MLLGEAELHYNQAFCKVQAAQNSGSQPGYCPNPKY